MRKNKVISFGLLIAAFIFFCNPNFNIFDILPDAIACLFVIAAISKLSDLCDDLYEAKHAFTVLFWVNMSKLPAAIVVFSITGNNMNEATMWLVAAFCYAVADAIFTIRAFSALFNGLAYLGARNDGGDVLYYYELAKGSKEKNKLPRVFRLENLASATSVFIIIKSAASTIPAFLYIYPQDDINLSGFVPTRFIPHLTVLCGIISLVFGIIWASKACSYVKHIAKQTSFWENISKAYVEKVLPQKGIFIMRGMRVFSIIFTFAVFFSVDLYFDEINYLPDFVSAALFFASAFVIEKYSDGAKSLKITSAVYFVTSLFTYIAMILFKTGMFSDFGYSYINVYANETAYNLYAIYSSANSVSQIAFIAVMMSAAVVMIRVVRAHTGINTITGVSNSSLPLVRVYGRRIMRMRALSVIAAIVSVLYFYLIVYSERRLNNLYKPQYSIIWMIDFFIGMVYAVHASNLASDILGEVKYKYKYE